MTKSFTASSLAADAVYTFKVTARNVFGLGADSSEFNIRAAAKPDDPTAPFTEANSNTSVTIHWAGPSNGGSAITAYSVAIRQSDGLTFSTELSNCNVSKNSCTVPIPILQAAPYNLVWGASIYAKVFAKNVVVRSNWSYAGNGAVISKNPDEPFLLSCNSLFTNRSLIAITWQPGVSNGGAPVYYRVSWD